MILDALQRFIGGATQPNRMTEARAALAEAITTRDSARATAEKAGADLGRVEGILATAAERIDSTLAAARSARVARQDARAAALARGESALTGNDAELAGRERGQLAALSDARIERRAAEQALAALRTADKQAKETFRATEERFTNALHQVVSAQVLAMTQQRLEELAAEFSELTRWRAAACEIGCKVAPPPRIPFQFASEHMREEMAALSDFRRRLQADSEAELDV